MKLSFGTTPGGAVGEGCWMQGLEFLCLHREFAESPAADQVLALPPAEGSTPVPFPQREFGGLTLNLCRSGIGEVWRIYLHYEIYFLRFY